ncbi:MULTISPECIES: DUF3667 domain-containing protein [unclassified Flavobacterium]|uniref:DUF3667 domain-containing protein n=1 Tax=unclassified Flavobacterium TaxID=196869 RepID=UPI0025C43EF0|nr:MULTISPECIES: DUF3667 domain-containing protein [unclassified Flavobacterium]
MNPHHCLNCDEPVHQNFCPICGQRTDTHRIVLKHFILHDMLHGVWHLDRGILFTIRETFVRPGQAALDYVSGKRIRYYNVFYLCLLVIGFNLLLKHYFEGFLPPEEERVIEKGSVNGTEFFAKNIKFILLGIVPILGLCGLIVFRRLKLNLAEHFILGGICLLGELLIAIAIFTTVFITKMGWLPDFSDYLVLIVLLLMVLYPAWVYQNAVRGKYTWIGFTWRMLLFYVLLFVMMMVVLTVIVIILSGGKGTVTF